MEADLSDLAGGKVVAFERLLDTEDHLLALHEDLADEGQTLTVRPRPEAPQGPGQPTPTKAGGSQTPSQTRPLAQTGLGIGGGILLAIGLMSCLYGLRGLSRRPGNRDGGNR